LVGAALSALALLCTTGPAHAATYKWVDEKGVVHYTDKLPPEEVNKARVELNKQGVQVKATEPAPTPEQRRAKAQEEERQKQLAKEQAEIARKDRALLSSYTSESEIDLARNRSLRTIESVVQSSKAYGEQLGKRKAGLEARKTTEFANKPMPPAIERELESINSELAKQEDLLALKQKEIVAVNAKYDADKKRWRELITAKGGEAALLSDVNALPAPPPPAKK
jgi:vacuolar-type H+-ATPase subunit I/STV1